MEVPHDLFLEWESHPPATDTELDAAEQALGYKLPEAYRAVLKVQNGGILRRCYFRGEEISTWISAFLGVGPSAWGLTGSPLEKTKDLNRVLIENWSYPEGVVICHQGHAGFILDYSQCGPSGEPRVLYALSEYFPKVDISEVAPSFALLLAGLTEIGPDGTRFWNENGLLPD